MNHRLLVMIWKYFSEKNSDLWTRFSRTFLIATWVIYTWIDSSKSLLLPWLVKSLKNSKKGFWVLTKLWADFGSDQIYIIYTQNSPIWLFFDNFDSSLTSYDFVWPDLTSNNLNFNPRQNSESKRMYIEYISTNPPVWTKVWPLVSFNRLWYLRIRNQ